MEAVRTGIIGCGMIARGYAASLDAHPEIELSGAADLDPARACDFAEKRGLRAYPSVDDLLADGSIELVLDLTPSTTHAAVVGRCLDAGKHVYCEKPLALDYPSALELAARAEKKGLRLGSAPATFMGEAQQTAAKWLREGRLGEVRLVYAEINHGRVESWHPSPLPFYECGLLFDMGPYPLVLLASIFGPVKRVQVVSRVLLPERRTRDGTAFTIEKPDFVVALIEFAAGPLARFTVCAYADWFKKQGESVEFHGDTGSLYLSHSGRFDAKVEFAEFNQPYTALDLLREPTNLNPLTGIDYGRGVADLAAALRTNGRHRAGGEMAAHVVEVMAAIDGAAESGRPVGVRSTFDVPPPMEWAS